MFLPTIEVTESDLINPQVAGRITPGQWLKLPSGARGRFVGLTPHGTVWVYWPETTRGVFKQMRERFVGRFCYRPKTLFSVSVADCL
jgi:hypothetical protein